MFLKSQKYLLTPDSVNLPDNVPKKRHNTSAAFQQLIYVASFYTANSTYHILTLWSINVLLCIILYHSF